MSRFSDLYSSKKVEEVKVEEVKVEEVKKLTPTESSAPKKRAETTPKK